MRCETARTILELNLPRLGEADWRDLDAVEAHLKTCPPCERWWRLRSHEDNRLAREIRAVPVPHHLASTLAARLPAADRASSRKKLIATLAAAFVLIFSGVGFWFLPVASPLDADAVARLLETAPAVDGPTSHERMEQLVESFGRLGETVRLPDSLNYLQVVSHGITELQGRKVPQILFQTEEVGIRNLVRLLILDSKKFDLSQYSVEQNTGLNRQVELIPDSENGRFFYLLSTQEMARASKY